MKRKLIALLLSVIVAVCPLLLCGCSAKYEEQSIDWTLHAKLISQDGQIIRTFQFDLSADIAYDPDDNTKPGTMNLDIVWPAWFQFANNGPQEYEVWPSSGNENLSFHASTVDWDLYQNTTVLGTLAIAPEKEYVIFFWDDTYLIASTKPNIPREDIESFFAQSYPAYDFPDD